MEDKNKNKIQLDFDDFLKIIEAQLEPEDDHILLLDRIKETLEKFNYNKQITKVTFKQDKNITSNVIYFLNLDNSQEYHLVIKIRKENSPMSYADEVFYLKKLESRGVVPKQLLNIAAKSNKIKIGIEEFINATHIPDDDRYNQKYMEAIVNALAKFHSIESIDYNEYEKLNSIQENSNIASVNNENNLNKCVNQAEENKKNIYLEYLINKYTVKSQRRFDEIIAESSSSENQLMKKYYEDNIEVFKSVKGFLYKIPELFEHIMENYSTNKNKLVFSHVDIHTWNFFLLEDQIKFIDFEDLSFTVPGFDLANYIIESEYVIVQEEYPFYVNEVNKTSEEFLLKTFKDYILKLNKESDKHLDEIGLDEIHRLFCLSLIKTVVEFVIMLPDEFYLKNELDLILLMRDRISRFYYFYNLLLK